MIHSLSIPAGLWQAASEEIEKLPAVRSTVFFTSDQQQFAFHQNGNVAEWTMLASGRVRARHAGPLGSDDLRTLERLLPAALAGRGQPVGQPISRDDVIGENFYFATRDGQQTAGNESTPAPAVTELLEWVRQHGPILPAVPHAGFYLIGYPIAKIPPSTPVETNQPSEELAAAVAQPFRPIHVTDATKQRRLPRAESEFTLEIGPRKFEIYYLEGAPFSIDEFLRSGK